MRWIYDKIDAMEGHSNQYSVSTMEGHSNRYNVSTPSDDRPPQVGNKWATLVEEFTQNTTLHGLRYIAQRESFLPRRLVWLVLTLVCSTLLVFQVIDRVTYYYQSPITVNFKVNYNQTLIFPAITVCNQNAFRATEATRLDWYRLVEYMYENGSQTTSHVWDNETGSDVHIDKLFIKLGHRKDDFIVSCEWASESCSPDDFSVTLTDHGLCYTFNARTETGSTHNVSSSGVEHGLRLTLNVEQYEAMTGPHDATGIKLLATQQSLFPRVNEIGLAIPTGSHAFVGLGVLVLNNLPEPHGDCGSRPLYSTDVYSKDVCVLECLTRHIVKTCGCRHFYMPNINGTVPVCTVKQYFGCFLHEHEFINRRLTDVCDCPTACHYLIYDPTISYASTSNNHKSHLLDIVNSSELEHRYFAAMETSERMNKDIFHHFEEAVNQVSYTFNYLRDLLETDIKTRISEQTTWLQNLGRNMTYAVKKKERIYRYQEYAIRKNFMRARDAMEERTLNMLCMGFHEHVFNTEFKLRQLFAETQHNSSMKETMYVLLKNSLMSKRETGMRALANYTQLYDAYSNGERIFNYKYYKHPRAENTAITPTLLMNRSLTHNAYARRYAPRVGVDIQRVVNTTDDYMAFATDVYDQVDEMFDIWRMHNTSSEFIDACEDYFHSKSTFYYEVIDRPLRIIRTRMQLFNDDKQSYTMSVLRLKSALDSLNDSLTSIRGHFLANITEIIALAEQYFNSESPAVVTKYELAKLFTSKHQSESMYNMVVFLADLRQRGQLIYDLWLEVKVKLVNIWKRILTDQDSVDYYMYMNLTIFLQNFTEFADRMDVLYSGIREMNDLRFVIQNADNLFISSFEALKADLRIYIDRHKMDSQFIRNNFLQLDVYFKELRHEQIDQQTAYDVIALLCDIGGSLGLFIGASVISLFELVDFFVNQAAEQLVQRYYQPRKR